MKKLNKKGFTLVEMLVVIAIIAVLVAIIIPTVMSATTKAAAATNAANLRSAKAELTTAMLADKDGYAALVTKLEGEVKAKACKSGSLNVAANAPIVISPKTLDSTQEITVTFGDGATIEAFAAIAEGGSAASGK